LGAPLGLVLVRWLLADLPHADGWVAAELRGLALVYIYVAASTLAAFVFLGAHLGAKEDQLQALSITDPLTGLANRRHFDSRLGEEVRRAQRHDLPLSLLVVDLDGLKEINSQLGHEFGDRALVAVARSLSDNIRSIDVAARIGGDEFAVLLPHTPAKEAVAVADRMRRRTLQLGSEVPSTRPVSASFGVTDLDGAGGNSAGDLFAAADRALFSAKASGRNQVFVADRLPLMPRKEAAS
jgi:diguanylate cyclase (GGDEF)-like protein